MAHGDAREEKWRGNCRMEWVASTLNTTSEHGVSSITTADAHTSAASSRLNWRPHQFKRTRPFRRKTKSGFCACAITFQLACARYSIEDHYHTNYTLSAAVWMLPPVVHPFPIIRFFRLFAVLMIIVFACCESCFVFDHPVNYYLNIKIQLFCLCFWTLTLVTGQFIWPLLLPTAVYEDIFCT